MTTNRLHQLSVELLSQHDSSNQRERVPASERQLDWVGGPTALRFFTIVCLIAFIAGTGISGCAKRKPQSKSWHDMPMSFVAPPARSTDEYVASRNNETKEDLKGKPVRRTIRSLSEALAFKPRVVKVSDATDLDSAARVEDPTMYIIAGRMSAANNQIETAEVHFKRALEMDKTNIEALRSYGELLANQEKYDEAIGLYRTAIDNGNENLDLASEIGYCLLMKGEVDKSISILNALVQQAPDVTMYREQLAFALVSGGRPESAMDQLATMMSQSDAWNRIGQIQNDLGQTNMANASFVKAGVQDDSLIKSRQPVNSNGSSAEALAINDTKTFAPNRPRSRESIDLTKVAPRVVDEPVHVASVTAQTARVASRQPAAEDRATWQRPQQSPPNTTQNAYEIRNAELVRIGAIPKFPINASQMLDIEREESAEVGRPLYPQQAEIVPSDYYADSRTSRPAPASFSALEEKAFDKAEADKAALMQAKIQLINEKVALANQEGGRSRPKSEVDENTFSRFSADSQRDAGDSKPAMSASLRNLLR